MPRDPDKSVPEQWPRGMRVTVAAAYIGLSVAILEREVKAGRLPSAVQLTEGRKVWLKEDLDAWLDRRAGRYAAPDAKAAWLAAI